MNLHIFERKKKWKKSIQQQWKLYIFLGIFFVVAAAAGLAMVMPGQAKADPATPTGWSDYPVSDSYVYEGTVTQSSLNLGSWEFNTASGSGSVKKLSDLTFMGTVTQDGVEVPCALIATEDQLKAVLSGLKVTMETPAFITRSQRIVFKMNKDLTYNGTGQMVTQEKETDDAGQTKYVYKGNAFVMDTFDGQGHTIKCTGAGNVTKKIANPSTTLDVYYGVLFGRVENATIKNLKVDVTSCAVKLESDNPLTYARDIKLSTLGVGEVCGAASSSTLIDIETTGTMKAIFALKEKSKLTSTTISDYFGYSLGIGGVAGVVQESVTLRRCEDTSLLENYIELGVGKGTATLMSVPSGYQLFSQNGGIVGVVSGNNNSIVSCFGCGNYNTYDIQLDKVDPGYLKYFKDSGAIIGGLNGKSANITIMDSVGASPGLGLLGMILYHYGENATNNNPSNVPTFTNCYASTGNALPFSFYTRLSNGLAGKGTCSQQYYSINYKREAINNTDWGYDGNRKVRYDSKHIVCESPHYLLHTCDKKLKGDTIVISSPYGTDHKIDITGSIKEWFADASGVTNADTANANAYLYVTTDGSDPQISPNYVKTQSGHNNANGNTDLTLTHSLTYSDVSKPLTINARIKVVFDLGTNNECVVWGRKYTKTFDPVDLYLMDPILETSVDDQSFEEFRSTNAYPLGTTRCQLTPRGELINETGGISLYYCFKDSTGWTMGNEDSTTNKTIRKETMLQQTKYVEPFALTEQMLMAELSNQLYLYVFAYGNKDGTEHYKLYEYDIVVYEKDDLVKVKPETGSRIASSSKVSFQVGNGQEQEYPYAKMNILVSETKQKYTTLEGQTNVQLCTNKIGDGTQNTPYYLTGETVIEGEPGQKIYVYVEPFVNDQAAPSGSAPYKERYGTFVQEYEYTIMDKASGLQLSPATITKSQGGNPTSVPINEKIYITTSGNNDIVVYDTSGSSITPFIVNDTQLLQKLETAATSTVGENEYCWGSTTEIFEEGVTETGTVLYVYCNNIWFGVPNTTGNLKVYSDGSLYFDSSFAGKSAYLSTLFFSSGYEPSDNVIYKYNVNMQDAVSAPTPLLEDKSSIAMNKVLNFSCDADCVMYYTIGGGNPKVTVNENGEYVAGTGTYLYNPMEGIVITQDKGFAYGETASITICAYPAKDPKAVAPVCNPDKRNSDNVTFTYTIVAQNQLPTPTAYPETDSKNATEVTRGDRIVLSCGTSGAEIYYTTDGSTPTVKEENKYTDSVPVEGDYGSYFTIKAIAHKEGMKDSEVGSFLYKISEKIAVKEITAIPATSTKVIAGDKIILSTTESGAEIYYTVDGSTPDVTEGENGYVLGEGVFKYDPAKAIVVPEGTGYFMVYAVAVKPDRNNSPVAEFVYSYAEAVGTPYGSPSPGTVVENTQVALQCAQKDAVIYYEIAYNGAEPKTPTTSSAVFSEKAPILITRDTKIKAFAYYNRESSEIVTLSYKLAQKMEAPETSIASGAVVPSGTTIKLPAGQGKVYYTTDGSDPTDASNTAVNVGSDIVITGKPGDQIMIKACTKESGATTSEMVTFTYRISQYPGGVTTDTPTGTTVSDGTDIHLVTDVTEGVIYYTTDAGSPISGGTAGDSVSLKGEAGSSITVKAVAIAPGTTMTGSYASFVYQMMEQLASPQASVKDGTILTEKTSITLKANKGKIYFTIDGTEPTKASNEYTAPIVVSKSMTLKAIAVEEGSETSAVSSFTYNFAQKVDKLKTSVSSGIIPAGENVRLSSTTKGARIYYTTDGNDPDPNAEEGVFVYDEADGINIYRSVNIKAVAVCDGMCASDVLSLDYQVEEVPAEVERERIQAEEEMAGLKPSDLTNLASRRLSDTGENPNKLVEIYDRFSDTMISGKESLIPEDATLRTQKISIPSGVEAQIKQLVGSDYESVGNYSFVLYRNGERIQPDGEVEIGIPIPQRYANADILIASINENNGVRMYNVRRENGYVYADVSHLNQYAVISADIGNTNKKGMNMILVVSCAAGGLALAGTGMIVRIVRKRREYQ